MKLPKRLSFIKYKKQRYEYLSNDGHAICIPSKEYPINEKEEIFLEENTEEITDRAILNIIDSVPYKVGQCYTNADAIIKTLQEHKIKAKMYVGWMIIHNELPQHHSWVVLQNKYLIDLSADIDNIHHFLQSLENAEAMTIDETREKLAHFLQEIIQQPHSHRLHLGKVSKSLLYIGCPCSKEKGVRIFNELMEKYPNHPCFISTDASGRTKTQTLLHT